MIAPRDQRDLLQIKQEEEQLQNYQTPQKSEKKPKKPKRRSSAEKQMKQQSQPSAGPTMSITPILHHYHKVEDGLGIIALGHMTMRQSPMAIKSVVATDPAGKASAQHRKRPHVNLEEQFDGNSS